MSTLFPDDLSKDFAPRNPVLDGVDPIIANRYSPRAFKPTELDANTINTLFDAARQAPSCFNEQPWHFYCSSAESFDRFLSMLVPANVEWAKDASAIVIVTASKVFAYNGKPNAHSWFDTGAAWYSMAYQARTMGLYTHAMAGIDKQEIQSQLRLPEDQEIICAVAIGVADTDGAQTEEISPRKSLDDILTII